MQPLLSQKKTPAGNAVVKVLADRFARSNARLEERVASLTGLLEAAGWEITETGGILSAGGSRANGPPPLLTRREREVLHWIVEGKTSIEIAAILGLSPRTVEAHTLNLCRKAGVSSRRGLILGAAGRSLPST